MVNSRFSSDSETTTKKHDTKLIIISVPFDRVTKLGR